MKHIDDYDRTLLEGIWAELRVLRLSTTAKLPDHKDVEDARKQADVAWEEAEQFRLEAIAQFLGGSSDA